MIHADELPVNEIIPELHQQLSRYNSAILKAPPGAGKSTVVPLALLQADWLNDQKIIVLEPRRLAARTIAARMAATLNETVGQTVGYRVRFDTKVSQKTRIEVITEGVMVRMLQNDNLLEGVGIIVFDEFHERSLQADLAFTLTREIQQVLREDLRILIMSATLHLSNLSRTLPDTPLLESKGRQYPVDITYAGDDRDSNIPRKTCRYIMKAWEEQKGDMLVFLPGKGEIAQCQQLLSGSIPEADVTPLHGSLSPQQQQKAITHDPARRKIVLATSIAETSLTIEGITTVVDSGFVRKSQFDARSGISSLTTVQVTLDAADQRAGRAGRLGPGVCYRLWSRATHLRLEEERTPEILDSDLAPLVLELGNWSNENIDSLPWLTPPPKGHLAQAVDLLTSLGAFDDNGITAYGRKLATYPAHPRVAHLFERAAVLQLLPLAADIATLLEENGPQDVDIQLSLESLHRYRKTGKGHPGLQRIDQVANSWCKVLKCSPANQIKHYAAGALLSVAFPDRIARRKKEDSNEYHLSNNRTAFLQHAETLQDEEWIVISALDQRMKGSKIHQAAPVHREDLYEMALQQRTVHWDNQHGQLIARTEWRIGDVILKTASIQSLPNEERIYTITSALRRFREKMFVFPEEIRQWQYRILSLRQWAPEEGWPDVSDEALYDSAEKWLSPYLSDIQDIAGLKKLDWLSILQHSLPYDLSKRAEAYAPTALTVPSGSAIKLRYQKDGSPPVLAARIQELFGMTATPTICNGRQHVMIHLLSPGFKPVQITTDLKSFWENTYSEVRKELRQRYIKHYWPEDPGEAVPVRNTRKPKKS